MKEIGENLRENRKKNGVSLEEASTDLGINALELESLENGNYKAFKDVYELKNTIRIYAKYLGLNDIEILDEFNDYLFEKTSRISILDLKQVREEEKKKISSPYTNIKPSRYNYAPIVLMMVILVFISLVVYIALSFIRKESLPERELLGNMEVIYEFTE